MGVPYYSYSIVGLKTLVYYYPTLGRGGCRFRKLRASGAEREHGGGDLLAFYVLLKTTIPYKGPCTQK